MEMLTLCLMFIKKGISSMDQKMMTMILHVCKSYRIYPTSMVGNMRPG